MKKNNYFLHLFLTILLCFVGTKTYAYDIAVENEDGVTIYYNIINEGMELEVTNYTSANNYGGMMLRIPENVTYMGKTLNVTKIGNLAFHHGTVKNVVIPNTVTAIGDYAFYYCEGLMSITIPNSVTYIGTCAFKGCEGLSSITIPNNVSTIEPSLFEECSSLAYVSIPNSVTSIGNYAFHGCIGLTNVSIPNSVTSIGTRAFQSCIGLTYVTIPNSVNDIGAHAFDSCNGLTTVSIGNSLKTIESYVFQNCKGLTSVTIPNSVTEIGIQAFAYCSALSSVVIGNSVESIGSGAFGYCSALQSVTIPKSVTSIMNNSFVKCSNLITINVEDGNVCFDSRKNCNAIIETETNTLFIGCKTTIIPNSVTTIGARAFSGCTGLTSITIPNSVTSIGGSAFNGCTGLTSITIPNSVTSIGREVFSGCNSLTSVISKMENPCTIDSNCFTNNVFYNSILYVPHGTTNKYKSTNYWSKFEFIEEGDPSGIAQIQANAVLIQANDGLVSISGLGDSERIAIYQTDGKQVATAKAYNGSASVATNISKGTPVIVKIGEKAVKVVMQ